MPAALRYLGWPLLTGILLALLIMQTLPHWVGLPTRPSLPSAPLSYAPAVQLAAPAVANLYTSSVKQSDLDDPAAAETITTSALGSAVILHSDGYLLTNNHVIATASQIIVALHDGREAMAEVVGSDPETDLAVLKIALNNLPTLPLGDSSQLRIGDVVLAIGNPAGVGQTVTMGIISATGRHQLGLNTYEDFLQTDASINQGNSGGALIDSMGRLVGINTAVLAGNTQGISFSIPSNLAVEVMQAILQQGRVTRGWLGLEAQSLTPEQHALLAEQNSLGVAITSVYEEGPAQQAGLIVGDIILSIDGKSAADGRFSMHQIARSSPNSQVTLEIWRNGERHLLPVTLGARPLNPPSVSP